MGDLREPKELRDRRDTEELLDRQMRQFRHRGAQFPLRADGERGAPECERGYEYPTGICYTPRPTGSRADAVVISL